MSMMFLENQLCVYVCEEKKKKEEKGELDRTSSIQKDGTQNFDTTFLSLKRVSLLSLRHCILYIILIIL